MSSLIFCNYYNSIVPKNKYIIFGFDLDYTLIKTKSGNVFPKNKDDWVLWNNNIKSKLNELSKVPNSLIVIFSNQKGVGKKDRKNSLTINEFQDKVNNIRKTLELDFIFIASLEDDIYRKPSNGMWKYITKELEIKIDKKNSFYVGDMAGRPSDKYDTDLQFAKKLKIKFMTPEEFFN